MIVVSFQNYLKKTTSTELKKCQKSATFQLNPMWLVGSP